jgi:hypothetical protein
MYVSLYSLLAQYAGVEVISIEEATIEEDGLLPAVITLAFTPNDVGFHALEFMVWALGDMRRGGANIRYYLQSPPPWLNTPGRSLTLEVCVYQRSEAVSDDEALEETTQEIAQMTEHLSYALKEHWPECLPKPSN